VPEKSEGLASRRGSACASETRWSSTALPPMTSLCGAPSSLLMARRRAPADCVSLHDNRPSIDLASGNSSISIHAPECLSSPAARELLVWPLRHCRSARGAPTPARPGSPCPVHRTLLFRLRSEGLLFMFHMFHPIPSRADFFFAAFQWFQGPLPGNCNSIWL